MTHLGNPIHTPAHNSILTKILFLGWTHRDLKVRTSKSFIRPRVRITVTHSSVLTTTTTSNTKDKPTPQGKEINSANKCKIRLPSRYDNCIVDLPPSEKKREGVIIHRTINSLMRVISLCIILY